jgi:hypothetical protein
MNKLLLSSRINGQAIDFGALPCGYTPVDLDTFAMDNGGTKKTSWLGAVTPVSMVTAAGPLKVIWR